MPNRDDNKIIIYNKIMHDKFSSSYNEKHSEIYNSIEQNRIEESLSLAINAISTESAQVTAFDFGSGTGNITKHLLKLGLKVVAGDVSEQSLKDLKKNFINKDIKLCILNGKDLSCFRNDSFDLIATYSVLHHIPDYLSTLEEFRRIVKPGGIIYIDHEVSSNYWEIENSYLNYLSELGKEYYKTYLFELGKHKLKYKQIIHKFISFTRWKNIIKGESFKNRITTGGDIHVFIHDHIEWENILNIFSNYEVVQDIQYLVCRERSDIKIWEKYSNKCKDMRMLILRKPK